MAQRLLIYGSYGYTGELIVARALEQGLRPILAGRNPERLAEQALHTDLEHRAFALQPPAAIDEGLAGIDAVLNCAGPFSRTAAPLVDACLRRGIHYLDITGEIPVFEDLAGRDPEARERGVMLMPGCGFDVVPSDCLAAHLEARLPDAAELTLAFEGLGRVSRGTAITALEGIAGGGAIRRDGLITPVPTAYKQRRIDFGDGPTSAVTIPWGDVSTAYYSTGIADIEVYTAMPEATIRRLRWLRHAGRLLRLRPVRALLERRIRRGTPGPGPATRERSPMRLWGEARSRSGASAAARLRTPNAYTLTAETALEIARRCLDGRGIAGFQTPSRVFGADFILGFDGCQREDLENG